MVYLVLVSTIRTIMFRTTCYNVNFLLITDLQVTELLEGGLPLSMRRRARTNHHHIL